MEASTRIPPIEAQSLTDLQQGLDSQALQSALRNRIVQQATKSYRSIFLEHFFTYFNLVNLALFALVLLTGRWRNGLFMGVVVANMVIGLVQEIRSKKVLDKLALLYQDHFEVLRNGKRETVDIDEIALGDLIFLYSGQQVPVDGIVRQGSCQVNESLLTGESEPVPKKEGDPLYAGCFLTSGACTMQAVLVADQTYSASLLAQAKRSRRYPSSLRDALDKIIRISSILIVPVGILLFAKGMLGSPDWRDAILSAVAAMVGMIPEGLVILTSIALSAGSVALARKKVLVQELYCIETLARVDTLCLDKTGTITQGSMKVRELVSLDPDLDLKAILSNVYKNSEEYNVTAQAIRAFLDKTPATQKPRQVFPFSSALKAMGACFGDKSYLVGAYSFMEKNPDPGIVQKIDEYASQGLRVLAICQAGPLEELKKGDYPCLGLIVIEDLIRPDAARILKYFEKQDVAIKIISGDDPLTVAQIARRVGVEGKAVNMSLPLDKPLEQVMLEASIFGRVSPDQKKEMVLALKKAGKTVAMTGDGVNDVLALREADCSIAMGSGSQAARAIASLVLLEDQFEAMPEILLQGRKVIHNITRTASLFLVKTLFSFGLSLLTLLALSQYPFEPIQLTLISTLTTGIPSFVLSLEPNEARVSGSFLRTVLARALPGALSLILVIVLLSFVKGWLHISPDSFSTISTWLAGMNALGVLIRVCLPFTPIRRALVIVMGVLFIGAFFLFYRFFGFVPLNTEQTIVGAILTVGVFALQHLLYQVPWSRLLARVS